jgi:hypothetical protein
MMEPWRAVEVHNGGVEARKEPWRVCRPVVSQIHITVMRSRVQIRI